MSATMTGCSAEGALARYGDLMLSESEELHALQNASARVSGGRDRKEALEQWRATSSALRAIAAWPAGLSSSDAPEHDEARRSWELIEERRRVEDVFPQGAAADRALRSAGTHLHELLFDTPRVVVDGNQDMVDATGAPRLLIEFMKIAPLQELVSFVNSFIDLAHARALSYDSRATDEMSQFLSNWLRDTGQNLFPEPNDPWRDQAAANRFSEFLPDTSSAHTAFRSWTEEFVQIRSDFAADSALAPAVDQSNAALDTLQRNADVAKATAAKVGDESLATHFATLATNEKKSAHSWTLITALGVIVTILLGAGVVAGWFTADNTEWTSQLVHLALTLPAAAGTAYASTIGSRHRQQAWWASTVAAQLHTFDAFSAPLPEDVRAHLRAEFGARMFAQPAFNTDAQKPDSAAITAPLTDRFKATGETST